MSISKKSLISNRSAAKKAVIARSSATPAAAKAGSIKAAPLAIAPRKTISVVAPRRMGSAH